MKKLYIITYEENGKVKRTRWFCDSEEDVLLSFVDADKWVLKIEEV